MDERSIFLQVFYYAPMRNPPHSTARSRAICRMSSFMGSTNRVSWKFESLGGVFAGDLTNRVEISTYHWHQEIFLKGSNRLSSLL